MPSAQSPNMGLFLPIPGSTPGPQWATELTANQSAIDTHDHTSGKGVAVPIAAITVNADFSWLTFGQTNVGYAAFVDKVATGNLTVNSSIGNVAGQPYWRDSAGIVKKVTLAGDPLAITGGSAVGGALLFTAIPAPATPAGGIGAVYVDSTSKALAVKNDAGVVSHTTQTKAVVANQFLTGVNDAGLFTGAQPDFTNLSGSIAIGQVANSLITNAKLANMATLTIKGNNTGGASAPLDLTVAQVNLVLPVFTSLLNGLAPLSGGGTVNFLRADGTWAAPGGGGGITQLTGDVTAGPGSGSQAATLANVPSGTLHAGSSLFVAIAAPATPAAGRGSVYVDSTSKNLAVKSDAGVVNHGIQTRTASANNWIRSIADDGSTTISQPAFTDISGTLGSAQFGPLTGNVTTSGYAATLAQIPAAVPAAGSILFTAIAAPATPAAGVGSVYIDSTAKNIAVKDDAGVVKHGVQTKTATATQFLTAISDAGAVTAAQPNFTDLAGTIANAQIAGKFLGYQVITSGTSYAKTSGTNTVIIELWGGGGAGGGSPAAGASLSSCGAGGGSGGYLRKRITGLGAGPFTVAIGAGGTGASAAVGGSGGSTTFNDGTTTYTANGGGGGQPGVTAGSAVVPSQEGTAAAISTNGDVNGGGAPGGYGLVTGALTGVCGYGGSTSLGGGRSPSTVSAATTTNGGAGIANTGGGGSGGFSNNAAASTGGNGGTGVIIVHEFT